MVLYMNRLYILWVTLLYIIIIAAFISVCYCETTTTNKINKCPKYNCTTDSESKDGKCWLKETSGDITMKVCPKGYACAKNGVCKSLKKKDNANNSINVPISKL